MNEKAKTKRRRSANKPKSGISSQLGQHGQTSTALYNAKEDQSDLRNQADNYVTHVKKQYNALLENVAAEARPRPPLQIQQNPHQDNSLQTMMGRIMDAGGINISLPKKINNTSESNWEDEPLDYNTPKKNTRRNDLMNVLNQQEIIQGEKDDGQDNVLDLNVKAVKSRGRPLGSLNKAKVPMKVSPHMKTRGTTAALNEMAAATPAADEINQGGDEPPVNVNLNEKAVAVKKARGRPKNVNNDV